MSQSIAHVPELSDVQVVRVHLDRWIVSIQRAPRAVKLSFWLDGNLLASGTVPFDAPIQFFEIRPSGSGTRVRVTLTPTSGKWPNSEHASRAWSLQLLPVPGESLLQLIEVSSVSSGTWTLDFTGPTVHVQKQLGFLTGPTDRQRFRFGGFTQHGQLLDLKDWFFIERNELCTGLIALRPGTWTHPSGTVGRVSGEGDVLRVDLPHRSPRARRSFLLAHGPTQEVLSKRLSGMKDFEAHDGYAWWPAHQVARLGMARSERLKSYARHSQSMSLNRPVHFAFGDEQAMERAIMRATGEKDLQANPLWAGDYAAAKAWMFKMLRRFDVALREAAYLHPLGNPVAARVLGPAAGMFHMLDFLGQLSDAERAEAAAVIATLAELLARRDFYPHDFATHAPEFPFTDASLYRGMLNQNFNTDRYVFVGLAGCVLPSHPHAARWRRHAIEQFESQMRAYVYPGGCWEESHTYANHVKMTLLPLVLALRHLQHDAVDLMANENFLATCRFFIPLLSPPDAASTDRRRIPGIGDHHYGKHDDFACTFAWLATLCPTHRDEFLWAWRAEGSPVGESKSMQATTFSPLLLPDFDLPPPLAPPPAPNLPEIGLLDGYGAFARRDFGLETESLLVTRCGPAWGHYHNDQGSFWWWVNKQLIGCDAGLGDGPLKFAHAGHNVPGYVGREPRQWLDRHPYTIDQCHSSAEDGVHIRCQIPTIYWMAPGEPDYTLPPETRPHVTRSFDWRTSNELHITDQFLHAPPAGVTFSLHAPAKSVRRVSTTHIEFDLSPSKLRLTLPFEPQSIVFHDSDATCGVTLAYSQQTLVHELCLVG